MHKTEMKTYALFIAWILTVVATLTTLYMSEILQIPACPLCWYQRLGIYPLAIILGIALYRNDYKIYIYALPLAIITAIFALYQYLLQMLPGFNPIHFCTANSIQEDCSQITWQLFGFITLPLLSFIGSLVLIGLLVLSREKN